MSQTAADFLCDRLIEWGVTRIYGYPGDGINGIMGALGRHTDKLRFIQVRHEEQAAFMACAHAKYTGEVGVCMATSGPGAIHLLNGLYDAKLDHQPVVAIMGQTFARAMGGSFQQEVKLLQLYSDVASAYCEQVPVPSSVRHILDRAMRTAQSERSVTAMIVPADVQDMDAVEEQPQATHTVHTGIGFWPGRRIPRQQDLQAAADILNSGSRVAMLVGAGALDATEEVMQVADTLGAGVAKALLGKAVVPDDVPYVTGSIGLLGTKPSWDLMQGADTLLMVGSGFPYSEFLPPIGQARGIQIDVSGRMLSIRYPMELALLGDSKQTLAELLPLLERKEDRSWQEKIVAAVEDWWKVMDSRAEPADVDRDGDRPRVRPQAVFAELSRQLPDRAVLSSDSGSAANWYARHIRMRTGMKGTLSGSLATMVPGMAYTIAAKFAYPDRVAVGTIGDGAMQMGGMAELITAAKYYRDWDDPRMVVVVLNNEDLNQVTWEQRAMAGDPKFDASQDLPYVPYAAFAELIGLRGITVDRSAQLAGAFEEAFAADRPVIVDVMTDPEEPPIPPHITFAQFEALTTSVLADPKEGVAGAVNAAREFAEGILPRR
ncbi:thiamine pyrophosphate-requiring protein [Pseudactinotalea sp. HY158]|uniref:thiamine pyrophosphate-requiring protein n=1 Tax=Pseudactinotalea sp. HY158 TaxID=2654547 RepID=UPI00129CB98E|nr:thiamine pyrophosphate-requiring protein [Pseudactinotalea sp. HY158]QGH68309.1 thiamine pyrophosphate-requiring protein [Pseudactinotalea sp. HY158]